MPTPILYRDDIGEPCGLCGRRLCDSCNRHADDCICTSDDDEPIGFCRCGRIPDECVCSVEDADDDATPSQASDFVDPYDDYCDRVNA